MSVCEKTYQHAAPSHWPASEVGALALKMLQPTLNINASATLKLSQLHQVASATGSCIRARRRTIGATKVPLRSINLKTLALRHVFFVHSSNRAWGRRRRGGIRKSCGNYPSPVLASSERNGIPSAHRRKVKPSPASGAGAWAVKSAGRRLRKASQLASFQRGAAWN